MDLKKNSQEKFNQLRKQAEELMMGRAVNHASVGFEDPLRLIHELQTFQIELELQNEELNQSREELILSRTSYVELYDQAPVGYVSLSPQGIVLKANLTFAGMLSKDRSQLIDHPLSAHILFKDQDIYYLHLRNLSDEKTPRVCELHMQRKDGTVFDARLESKVHPDESKGSEQYLMIVRDISEMKQAEKALLASQEIFQMVSENIDQEIYLFQSDYSKVSYINPAAESIYGVPFHDLYDDPMAWARNIHPEDMEKIKADLKEKKGFDIKGSEYHEFRVNHPEKGEIWIGSNLFSIKNKPGYAVGISTDITERKILERKQKLDNQGLEDKVKEGTAELEEMNTALKILLRGIEKDKNEIGDRIFSHSQQILIPILDTLDKTMTQKKQKDLMDILRSELKNILSPFSKKLSDKMINLTPMEIHVASLIKSGKSNKEISQLLNSSIHTISRHRENIREKTDLKNSKINLRAFLLNLDESLF